MNAKAQALAQVAMKLGQAIYEKEQAPTPRRRADAARAATAGGGEEVVDAEFSEVDDESEGNDRPYPHAPDPVRRGPSRRDPCFAGGDGRCADAVMLTLIITSSPGRAQRRREAIKLAIASWRWNAIPDRNPGCKVSEESSRRSAKPMAA
jgi:hypothetical protein